MTQPMDDLTRSVLESLSDVQPQLDAKDAELMATRQLLRESGAAVLAKAATIKALVEALEAAVETLDRVTLVQTRSGSIIQQARVVVKDLKAALALAKEHGNGS